MSNASETERSKGSAKSVQIVEVSSEEIVQHIVPLKDFNEKRKKSRAAREKAQALTYSTAFTDKNTSDSDNPPDDVEDILAPSGTKTAEPEEEDAMTGKTVFQFKTHKKLGQMALKALEGASPSPVGKSPRKSFSSPAKNSFSSPAKNSISSPAKNSIRSLKGSLSPSVAKTPPRSTRKSQESGALTPLQSRGVAAIREHKTVECSTPYRLRKRVVEEPQESSSDDDSVEEDSSEGEDGEVQKSDISGTTHKTDVVDTAASAEAYFDLHAHAPVTSDRTLASLEGPRLDVDTVRSVLAKLKPGHSKECRALMVKHAKLFDKWMLHMCYGFNILLHGLGSKRDLMEQFRKQHLTDFSHLVVNGYFPSLTVKNILNSITEDILECSKGFTNPQAQLEFIKQEYSGRGEDFYLVIHNIDGVLLRSEKNQAILSQLARVEGFHIIASLDHINAAFMWDQAKYFRFRWLWYETPTFAPYESENWYENSLLVQQSGGLALSSLAHVMHSLTPNARNIFLELARYQMENSDNPNYGGMSFQALYHKCREAFLVNSDLTLQAQLVEFKDHRLLKAKKNFEGIEHLSIPIDNATLKEFLQDYQ